MLEALAASFEGNYQLTLMLGVILCILLFREKGHTDPKQRRSRALMRGGAALCVLLEIALTCEAAVLELCIIGVLLYCFVNRDAILPSTKGKAAKGNVIDEPQSRMTESSAAPGAAERTFTRPKLCTLEVQARDIVRGYTPTRCDEHTAKKLAGMAKRCIGEVIPEAEVQAIPTGNAAVLAARGAQPEIDLVVTVAPEILAVKLQDYCSAISRRRHKEALGSPALMHKTATRILSEMLNFTRFWRSQLTSTDCKIVLVIPAEKRICPYPVYIHLYLNTQYPLRMQQLLSTACLRRAKLLHVVTHWTRQRCIANVQRGQLGKYAWATLVCYFCENRAEDFKEAEDIIDSFRRFVEFYADWFDQDVAPSVCFTKIKHLAPEKMLLNLPYIEDYLEAGVDLAVDTTVDGIERVKEELHRAREICGRTHDKPAGDLFEKWTFTS